MAILRTNNRKLFLRYPYSRARLSIIPANANGIFRCRTQRAKNHFRFSQDTLKIVRLNDQFRRTFSGGKVVTTAGVAQLEKPIQAKIFSAVQNYKDFNKDNAPYGEHDFGDFEIVGERFFWKIDYYDKTLTYGSENPADPKVTIRVLTIMYASEY